jgi:hypothetical protein
MHNLNKVTRDKSDSGIFSDYPHFYKFKTESKNELKLCATRHSENGDFIISKENVTYQSTDIY